MIKHCIYYYIKFSFKISWLWTSISICVIFGSRISEMCIPFHQMMNQIKWVWVVYNAALWTLPWGFLIPLITYMNTRIFLITLYSIQLCISEYFYIGLLEGRSQTYINYYFKIVTEITFFPLLQILDLVPC